MPAPGKIVVVADNTLMGELGICCYLGGFFQKHVKTTIVPPEEQPKTEEPVKEEVKVEEVKTEEVKIEEVKTEEVKTD